MAEGLSALIREREAWGIFHGIGVARGAIKISYLLFVDDSFIFFKASPGESGVCRDILECYAGATGQLVNLEKSSLSFSKNLPESLQGIISTILGVSRGIVSGNYLGLLSLVDRNKREVLGYIKSRFVSRI